MSWSGFLWWAFWGGLLAIPFVIIAVNIVDPRFGLADEHVTTQPSKPGYVVSCYEDHRLIVEYANEGRAFVRCERVP